MAQNYGSRLLFFGADGTRRTLHLQVHWSFGFFWRGQSISQQSLQLLGSCPFSFPLVLPPNTDSFTHSLSLTLTLSSSLCLSLLSLIHSPLPNLATREVCGTGASIIDRASVQTWCRICGMWASSWGFEQGRHYVILHILRCLVHLYACPFHKHTLPQTLRNTNMATNIHTKIVVVFHLT